MTRALFVALLLLGAVSQAEARVSHVSINKSQFTLGEHPRLRVNVVSERGDFSRLEFSIRQRSGEEKLMVEPVNNFMLLLTGVDNVTDASAELVVREYVVNQWRDYRVIPLFGGNEPVLVKAQQKPVKPARTQEQQKVAKATVTAIPARENEAAIPVLGKVAPQPAAPDVATSTIATSALESVQATSTVDSAQAKSAQVVAATVTSDALVEDTPAAPTSTGADCRVDYRQGETLWRIASRYAPAWHTNVYGTMLALFEANPAAFAGGKIGGMKQGAKLDCPSPALLSRYPDAREARKLFEAHQAE